jgi:hypothetical protein
MKDSQPKVRIHHFTATRFDFSGNPSSGNVKNYINQIYLHTPNQNGTTSNTGHRKFLNKGNT